MTSVPQRKRTRLSPEARREQILDEAARLTLEAGLYAVSMERLARDVGISKGLVYNYFPTRDALLAALLHREQTELRDRGMATALQAASYAELIRQTTRLYLEQTRDRGALITALLSDPSVARLMEADSRVDRERTVRFFVRATRREFDLSLEMAIAAVGMLMAVTEQAGRLVAQGQADVDAATEMCVELITGGKSLLDFFRSASQQTIAFDRATRRQRALDDLAKQLERPVAPRLHGEAAHRVFFEVGLRAAMRTRARAFRVRRSARVAHAHEPGRAPWQLTPLHHGEHQLLRPQADPVAVRESVLALALDRSAVDANAIAAAEVDDHRLTRLEHANADVLARDEWIFDRDVTFGATPDHDLRSDEIEFLQ